MAFKITKKIRRQIAAIADQIPKVPLATREVKSGAQILDDPTLSHLHKNVGSSFKRYVIREGGSICMVNHSRRLEKAYELEGEKGILKYLEPYRKPEKKDE